MRIYGITLFITVVFAGWASATTINLNDGRVVQGDIITQDSKSVQVNVDGVTMTYYADEIKDIDGKSLAGGPAQPADQAAAAAPAVSAPAAQSDAAASAAAPVAASQEGSIDPEKRALILKFIDVFGTRQALTNNFELMLKQIEKEKPEEAQKIRDRVKIDEIIEHLLPIYDRNFTSEDLKTFIAFYGSAEGQKLIATIPELMKESVQESVKYMQEKFPEVAQGKQ